MFLFGLMSELKKNQKLIDNLSVIY